MISSQLEEMPPPPPIPGFERRRTAGLMGQASLINAEGIAALLALMDARQVTLELIAPRKTAFNRHLQG